MITIFNRKEFAVALTHKDRDRFCRPLDEAGIPYVVRAASTTHGMGRSTQRGGMIGIDTEYAFQYRIYVHKSDYERAVSLRK